MPSLIGINDWLPVSKQPAGIQKNETYICHFDVYFLNFAAPIDFCQKLTPKETTITIHSNAFFRETNIG